MRDQAPAQRLLAAGPDRRETRSATGSACLFFPTPYFRRTLRHSRQIAGADAGPEIQEFARRVAEAQIDLRRIRVLRHHLISRALRDPDYDSRSNWNKKVPIALRIVRRSFRCEDIPDEEVRFLNLKPEGPDKFTTIFTDIVRRLPTLDRYGRRALSRRKLAIRDFDAARTRLVEAVRPHAAERHSDD